MGIFSKLGSGALKGVGNIALGGVELTGKAAMGTAEGIGKSILSQVGKNPGAVLGSVAFGAAAGGIIADQDGQKDPSRAAMQGGAFGLGAVALGGGAAMSGMGLAMGGAAVMGVTSFGQLGRMMMSPKTIGDKANEVTKTLRAEAQASGKALTDKALKEALAKQGLKAGSKEAMSIGLGNLSDFKINKGFAVPAIVGASLVKGIGEGVKEFEKSRMGMNDGMMRSATPMMPNPLQAAPSNPSYANNAGATGDLVFAMHKNR